MENFARLAHPYATAAFQYADEKNQQNAWRDFLNHAAAIAKDPEIASLLRNPEIPTEKIFALFVDLLAPYLSAERKNFLSIIRENKRFMILPEISAAFNAAYDALLKISHVVVITAVPIDADFEQKLVSRLSNRLQRKVKIQNEIDPAILGGMKIRMDDQVLDLSVNGKLNRLLESFLR